MIAVSDREGALSTWILAQPSPDACIGGDGQVMPQ